MELENIPVVVDKNGEDGNYCRSCEAKVFINDEPIARTLTCKCGGGQEVHHNNLVAVIAMRGRGKDNKQKLEANMSGTTNTLTTVQKDNLCLEIKQATKGGSIKCKVGGCYDASYPGSTSRRGRVQNGGDVTPTITAEGSENINYIETEYRIRKLTPKECWRLMGYTDEDFDKALSVNSNTQLYKQAGNAIVKQVLMAIFSQLNIKGVKAWNDMTETEKRDIIKKTTMAGE